MFVECAILVDRSIENAHRRVTQSNDDKTNATRKRLQKRKKKHEEKKCAYEVNGRIHNGQRDRQQLSFASALLFNRFSLVFICCLWSFYRNENMPMRIFRKPSTATREKLGEMREKRRRKMLSNENSTREKNLFAFVSVCGRRRVLKRIYFFLFLWQRISFECENSHTERNSWINFSFRWRCRRRAQVEPIL